MSRRAPDRSLYRPGDSWLHRAPVGAKLAVLVAVSTLVLVIDHLALSAAVLVAAVPLAWTAGIPPRFLLRQLRAILVLVAVLAAVQAAIGRWEAGAHAALRLLAIAALAVVLTATTPAPAFAAWIERVLTRLRVRPDRVMRVGLTVGLAMRSIDHLGHVAGQVLDARRARGLQRSVRAFAVPTVVAAARFAHGVGEALEARGIGGGPPEESDG